MSERTLEMRKAELSAIFQCFTVKEKVGKAKGSLIMEDITNRSAVITLNPLKELRRSIDPEKGFHLTLDLERDISQRLDDFLTVEEQIDQKSISSRASCKDMFIARASKLPRGSYLDEEATDKEEAAERSDVGTEWGLLRVKRDIEDSFGFDEHEDIILVPRSVRASRNGGNELC
ncbi:hypothetical protein P167DRAFT_569356 [Morchella conica CCBAS932]|uniref:Uncharacterized protein n=1 Tax=Morchella conica CCBAS932 TaxID=1392247 RepID=A0A3N4L4Y0_9PEZI|nr:hypothetical protein P167DRAFT_569356 [Morchella conica CCBAS932]